MAWSVEALQKHLSHPDADQVVAMNLPTLQSVGVFAKKKTPQEETELAKQIRKEKRKANQDRLRKIFDRAWLEWGEGYPLKEEHKFHPKRKWQFDYCHLESKVAIELEGGTNSYTTKSRHTTPDGYKKDRKKYNAAMADGWVVLSLTSDMIGQEEVALILTTIKSRVKGGVWKTTTQCTT